MGSPSLQLDAREQGLVLEMVEALGSSLKLGEVLDQAYGLLARVLPADCAAMCVSQPELPGGYDWVVTRMPEAFVTHYGELSAMDFVREAVVHQPNVVLRDTEMVAPRALERTALYQRCHEIGFPMEHVMSVLLDPRGDWHGGLTLYRERQRPFSDKDRALLQRLTPMLVNTVRNCRLLGQESRRASLLDSLFHHQGAECVVLAAGGREVMRTEHATRLLERWFSPLERAPGGLPVALLAPLSRLASAKGLEAQPPDAWLREGPVMDLRVTYVPLPPDGLGRREWALLLQETPHGPPLPEEWRERLTPREGEVVAGVLRGWDNQLIADDLKCSLGTVKKHLQHVFDKLGVSSRAALLHHAARRR
jgi:DNA-binding CsgD family transcriptional regulator